MSAIMSQAQLNNQNARTITTTDVDLMSLLTNIINSMAYQGVPFVTPYASKSASYQILATDYFIVATGTSTTITLPDATLTGGQSFVIKNGNASGGSNITIATLSSQTVDRTTPAALTPLSSNTYSSDGSNWWLT